jgi:Conjugal transfer protein TraD
VRHDTREWVVKRRERTRHLIKLGGLVQKSGLVDLTGDDRAVLYGAFLDIASMLQGNDREDRMTLWRRRGSRAFKSYTDAPPVVPESAARCRHDGR